MDLQHRHEALYQEALGLKTAGRLQEAEAVEAKAAQLFSELKSRMEENPDSLEAADFLLFLAEREWPILGDHPDVQSKIERALAIRRNHFGPSDAAVADAIAKLAEFHFLAGRWGHAEPYYRRAIALYEKQGQTQNVSYARCEGGLAQTLASLGRTAEADPHFIQAIALAETQKEDKRIRYFLYIYRAEGLEKLGRGAEAAALRLQANALLPKNNPGEQGFRV
jgi:tetratricopeptide (TPR) repeat protein